MREQHFLYKINLKSYIPFKKIFLRYFSNKTEYNLSKIKIETLVLKPT